MTTPALLSADQIEQIAYIAAWAAEYRRTTGKVAQVAHLGGGWYSVNECSRWQKRHFVAATTSLTARPPSLTLIQAGSGLLRAISQARDEGETIPAWLDAAEDVALAGPPEAAADGLLSAISIARNEGEDIPEWLDKAEDEGVASSEPTT